MPTTADILAARERICDAVALTPCIPALGLGDRLPCRTYLKLENLQRTGSFKDRGALNRILSLSEEECARGVVTASAGNHAQAVAYHAGRLAIPATVVMPEHTPLIKVSNTRRYGARIFLRGATLSDAMTEALRLGDEDQLVLIHAYDDERVIAGQGTVGLELVEQVPDLTTVLVPLGGGGLISGIALAIKEAKPEVRIIGVEAASAASALASREAGHLVGIEITDTIADGIATKQVGELTFPIIQDVVDDIVVVTEEEIGSAVHLLLERQKIVAEGAGSVGLAAILGGHVALSDEDVAVIVVSGGNIDVTMIERIVDRGLVNDGRLARLKITVPDRPGALARLTQIVAECGANVVEIAHQRAFADISVGEVEIVVHLETRGRQQIEDIKRRFAAAGRLVKEVH